MQKDVVAKEVAVSKNIANVSKQEFLATQTASALIARTFKAVKKGKIFLNIKRSLMPSSSKTRYWLDNSPTVRHPRF